MLHIYNSLTQKKEEFKPIVAKQVSMYVCGMTVYDFCHIGHARVLVAFDIVSRFLRHLGYQVKYVRNITDIDDKIINRANDNNESFQELTERFIKAMHEDIDALGVEPVSEEPKATDHIPHIIAMVQQLLENNHAYVADDGDVYYRVGQFDDYGKLSKQDLDALRTGARVAVADSKQDPLDFVLWKQAKPNEPSWESPWGKGRPGWHIECSAMSTCHLGEHFDIHGGGFDLRFPHHENEIAQSEAATGKEFVNTWMHVGFVQVDNEKMSKSLGNFFTIREVLAQYTPEVVRYFLLSSHYRSQLNYSQESLANAKASLERFYLALRDLPVAEQLSNSDYYKRFNGAMCDDFNTPEALAVMFELARDINKQRDKDTAYAAQLAATLKDLGKVFGILQENPEDYFKSDTSGLSEAEIESMIVERQQARAEKNWSESDRIRDELAKQGVVIEDKAGSTTWRRA